MSALDKQVGGSHYKDFKIQPIEFIQANNIPYCEANAIKYLCRWREKGGIEDLEKAKHYIDLAIGTTKSDHFLDTERNKPIDLNLPSMGWEKLGLKADDLVHGTYRTKDGWGGSFRYFPAKKVNWDEIKWWDRAE
jgi:hypothetical protein